MSQKLSIHYIFISFVIYIYVKNPFMWKNIHHAVAQHNPLSAGHTTWITHTIFFRSDTYFCCYLHEVLTSGFSLSSFVDRRSNPFTTSRGVYCPSRVRGVNPTLKYWARLTLHPCALRESERIIRADEPHLIWIKQTRQTRLLLGVFD